MNRPRREPSSLVPRSRLSAGDWEEAAIDVLSQHGLSAIAVEPLAQRMGVTKGSFYAHFDTRDDLIAAVLARWEAVDTDQAIRDVEQIEDPAQRLSRLLELNFERPRWGRAFAALCASVDDPRVKPFMDRVYRRRLAYFEQALLELGVDPVGAQDRAGFWRIIAVPHGAAPEMPRRGWCQRRSGRGDGEGMPVRGARRAPHGVIGLADQPPR